MILMHRQKFPILETQVVQSCPGTSAPRTPSHPDIPQVCYSLRNRCSQEALYVNGILINDHFHCNKAAGYLKKPHRESFHLIKELLQRENSSPVSCPTPSPVFYKFSL